MGVPFGNKPNRVMSTFGRRVELSKGRGQLYVDAGSFFLFPLRIIEFHTLLFILTTIL